MSEGRRMALCGSLPPQAAPAMPTHTAVSIHDDLAASEPGIAVRSADHEAAGRVDVVFRLGIHHVGRDHGVDDVLAHFAPQVFGGDVGAVLGGDHDGFDALRLAVHVFHGDLALAVGAKEVERAVAAAHPEGAAGT